MSLLHSISKYTEQKTTNPEKENPKERKKKEGNLAERKKEEEDPQQRRRPTAHTNPVSIKHIPIVDLRCNSRSPWVQFTICRLRCSSRSLLLCRSSMHSWSLLLLFFFFFLLFFFFSVDLFVFLHGKYPLELKS